MSGGHRFDHTRFTQPPSAPSSAGIHLPERLLAAMGPALTGADRLDVLIRQSSLPFVLGNRLDEFTTVEAEVFWVATALEQLLDVSNRPPNHGVTATFTERLVGTLTSGSSTTAAQRAVCQAWARELYGRRSDVHGHQHPQRRWDPGWHAFLATVAFGLLLRRLRSDEGRYVPTAEDEVELAAFPVRLGRFRARRLVSGEQVWRRTKEAVERARLRAQIVEHLNQLQVDDGPDPGSPDL